MDDKIKALLIQLKNENKDRSIALNDGMCSEYNRTVLTHKYNNTLSIIKRIESLYE